MKAFVTHFPTYLMLLISLAAICLAIVSSQASQERTPNPCFSNQQGTKYAIPGKCTSYIYCQSGLPVELPCNVGDGFSMTAKGCVDYDQSDCVLMNFTTTTQLPTTSTTTTTTTTTTVTTTTISAECMNTEQREENKVQCAGKPAYSFQPYPGDCSKYLMCNCEYPMVLTCSAGMWFNPTIKECDSSQSVDCPWTTTSLTTLTTEATSNGISMTTDSLESSLPSDKTTQIDDNSDNTTQDTLTTETDSGRGTSSTDTVIDSSTTENPLTSDSISNSSSTINSTVGSTPGTDHNGNTTEFSDCLKVPPPSGISRSFCAQLPTEETGSNLHPYIYNCNAYINCATGCPVLAICPDDKVFNAVLSICDTPGSVDCENETLTTTEDTTATTQMTVPTLLPTNIPEGICLHQPSNTLLPYTGNCSEYILCQNGVGSLQSCPKGFLFDPDLLICNGATDVTCNSGQTTTPMTTASTVGGICAGVQEGTTSPYYSDCSMYYYCNGQSDAPQILQCPKNNWFNPDTGNCGPNVSTDACRSTMTTTTATPPTPQEQCSKQKPNTALPNVQSCDTYILCTDNGGATIIKCPSNNYFNPLTGNCGPNVSPSACTEIQSTSTSSPTSTTPFQPSRGICYDTTDGQIVPYPNNCRKYITCVLPAPIAFDCPSGMAFNVQVLECEVPTDNSCTMNPNTPTASPPSKVCDGVPVNGTVAYPDNCLFYIRCYESSYMLESCNMGQYYDPATSRCSADVSADACSSSPSDTTTDSSTSMATTLPPFNISVCDGMPQGFMVRYPGSCTKYIVCESPLPVTHECSEGLEFSITEQACTDPESANCNEPSTSTPTSSESTTSIDQTTNSGIASSDETTSSGTTASNASTTGGELTSTSIETTSNGETTSSDETSSTTLPTGGGTTSNGQTTNSETTSNGETDLPTSVPSTETPTSTATTTTSAQTSTPSASTLTTNQPTPSCSYQPDGTALPDPTDCSKYIYCVSGLPVVINCSPGTFFNPELGSCNQQTSPTACREENTSTTTDPIESVPTSTSNSETTSSGQSTNSETTSNGETDLPTSVPSTETPTSTATVTTSGHTSTPSASTLTTNQPTPSCSYQPDGTALPDPTDCSKYIYCVSGLPVVINCSPGTFFNPELGSCNEQTSPTACSEENTSTTTNPTESESPSTSPITSQSTGTPITSSSTPGTSHTGSTETGTSTSQEVTSTPLDTTTPSVTTLCQGLSQGTLIPYPHDCSMYISCGFPTPTINSCQAGLEFSAEILACVDPEESGCSNTYTTTTTTITPISNPCANEPNGAEFPLPDTCTTYIFCINHFPLLVHCPPDTFYDPITGICGEDIPPTACHSITKPTSTSQTTATSPGMTPTTTPLPASLCTNQPDGTTLPNPNDCTQYVYCLSGSEQIIRCTPGSYYNPSTEQCGSTTSPTACRETSSTTSPTTPGFPSSLLCTNQIDGTTFANPDDCSQYIVCNDGIAVTKLCQTGTYYNPEIGICESNIGATDCQSLQVTTTMSTSSTSTTIVPPNNENVCCGKPLGTHLPYPKDNTKFIICQYPVPTTYSCPPSTTYNPQKEQCLFQNTSTNHDTTGNKTNTSSTTDPLNTNDPPNTPNTTTDPVDSSTVDPPAISTPPSDSTQDPPIKTTTPITPTDPSSTVVYPPNDVAKICKGQKAGTPFQYVGDCRKYNFCFANSAIALECNSGWYFDPSMKMCVPPSIYTCPWS